MQNKNNRERNIAVQIKDKVDNSGLIPNISYGIFRLGTNIQTYCEIPHTVREYKEKTYEYKSFFFENDIEIWVKENKIDTIRCIKYCYWKNFNLIGMLWEDFLEKFRIQPSNSEKLYVLVNDKGQNQIVFDFDKLGLQIWVWRKKIVTVLIFNGL